MANMDLVRCPNCDIFVRTIDNKCEICSTEIIVKGTQETIW